MRSIIITTAVAGAALAGVGLLGWAGPAAAESLEGSYTRANHGNAPYEQAVFDVVFTPCGSDCTTYALASGEGVPTVLHLRGNNWVSDADQFGGVMSFDKDSLQGANTIGSYRPGAPPTTLPFTLTKNN